MRLGSHVTEDRPLPDHHRSAFGRAMAGGGIGRFILRRLAIAGPLLVLISIGVFLLIHLAPGSPERVLLGGRPATSESLAAIRARFNLDRPLAVQYLLWLAGVLQGDLGRSIQGNQLVADAIARRLGVTVYLGVYVSLIAVGLGIPLGAWTALRRGTSTDRAITTFTVFGISAPAFATGLLLLYLFGVVLGWFPTFGAGRAFWDRLWHLTLPAVALGVSVMALIVKITRASMIEQLQTDYVAFARARGLGRRHVLVSHVLRNTLVPVLTAAGLVVVALVAGGVLVEVTFGIQGIGTLLVDSVQARDMPLVQGLVLLTAAFVIVVNLILDVLYTLIDPRIRFGRVSS